MGSPLSRLVSRVWRSTLVSVITAMVMLVAVPASADPAGPTDFQNEILRVEPEPDGVTFSVVGGDAFLRAEVEPGTELVVVGYFGEPYVRITADGTVEENANSPSVVLNEDRYGEVINYDRSDAELDPDWVVVGDGGVWAWHDHRTHWMSKTPPPGRVAGDVVYGEVSVPVEIDGLETRVYLSLTWLERSAPIWSVVGAVIGAAAVWFAASRRSLVLAGVGVLALMVGAWQYLWLPAETEPSFLQWAVPAVALLFIGAGIRTPAIASTATTVAAAELLGWGIWRWESTFRAILPTGAPYPLDRAVTAAAITGGLLGLVLYLFDLLGTTEESPTLQSESE